MVRSSFFSCHRWPVKLAERSHRSLSGVGANALFYCAIVGAVEQIAAKE